MSYWADSSAQYDFGYEYVRPGSLVVTRRIFDLRTGKLTRSYRWKVRRHNALVLLRSWRPRFQVRVMLFPKLQRRLERAEAQIALLESQIEWLQGRDRRAA